MDHQITEAVVLAGGLGTRLRSEIGEYPKPLAPINNTPFLTYLFEYLIEQNIQTVYLSVGFKWEMIQEEYGSTYKNLKLVYVVEKEPLGTGGGIRLALEQCQNSSVFIINGDTYFKVNLQKLSDFYFQQNAKCALALKKLQKVDRYGNVELENEKIVAFKEKEFREETIINGGIYCLNKSALDDFEAGSKFSFEKDFLEIDTAKQAFFGLCFDDYFMDIGIPTDYHQFSKDVLS